MTTRLGLLDASGDALYAGFQIPGGEDPPPPDPDPDPPPPVNGTTEWPPAALVGSRPSRASILANAGLSDPGALPGSPTSSGITVTTNGALIEDRNIDGGNIEVRANNVTIRNCRIKVFVNNGFVIRLNSGYKNLLVENCYLEMKWSGTSSNGAAVVGQLGEGLFVYNCEITGFNADGAKGVTYSLFQGNYIHMDKSAGSTKHLDGIQATAKQHVWVRRNVIDMPIENNGNSPYICGPYVGGTNDTNYVIKDLLVQENHILGGNTCVLVGDGKPTAKNPTNPGDPGGFFNLGTTVIDNVFYRDFNDYFPQETAFLQGASTDDRETGSIRYRWLQLTPGNPHYVVTGNENDLGEPLSRDRLQQSPGEGA